MIHFFLRRLNRFVCQVMFGVKAPPQEPLPPSGAAILVCDHTSLGDPLVLLATAGRPVRFLMAEEIYSQACINWVFRAFQCIPVCRGKRDPAAVRTMLEVLEAGEVVGMFPEGGLDRFRLEEGYSGVGYLALKSGAPVIPASVVWEKPRPSTILRTLFEPCQARVGFAKPLLFPQQDRPTKNSKKAVTVTVMQAISRLRREILETEGPRSAFLKVESGTSDHIPPT